MSTTKHTSFIPMSPELLPRQKLNEVVTIPDHPKGLAQKVDLDEPLQRDRPKASPRKLTFLCSVEWAWSPMHNRIDNYYLNPRRSGWLLWNNWVEDEKANAVFPESRLARGDITLKNGQILASTWFEPKWDPSAPPTEEKLTKKFHDYATPVLGDTRTQKIYDAIMLLENTDTQNLFDLLSVSPEGFKPHVS